MVGRWMWWEECVGVFCRDVFASCEMFSEKTVFDFKPLIACRPQRGEDFFFISMFVSKDVSSGTTFHFQAIFQAIFFTIMAQPE